jgi:hypothetical protein
MNARPSDIEIAQAICCGEHCRTDTTHCHAGDHFGEAYRVRKLLDRYSFGSGGATETAGDAAAVARGHHEPRNRAPNSRKRKDRK